MRVCPRPPASRGHPLMFDIGFWELLLIMGLGLLILGPERLPRVAQTVGSWMGQARRVARNLRRELEREVALADIKRSTDTSASASNDEGNKIHPGIDGEGGSDSDSGDDADIDTDIGEPPSPSVDAENTPANPLEPDPK